MTDLNPDGNRTQPSNPDALHVVLMVMTYLKRLCRLQRERRKSLMAIDFAEFQCDALCASGLPVLQNSMGTKRRQT
jgi:hypothetical protein